MTNINDVKKCRDVLTHLKNTLPNCRFNFEIFQNERIFSNNIDTAISILDKIIAGKLVEKYYENDEVTDDTQCDLYGDR